MLSKRTVIIAALVVLVLALAGELFVSPLHHPAATTLAVTSPTAGPTWVEGSGHTVTWSAPKALSSDKVSITIRRIPPPPLPLEGQEFDPIIATDLPNTGSFAWTISDMYPEGTYVLGVTAYPGVPITSEVSAESAPFTLERPLASDLYPLYDGATWGPPVPESVTIGTTTLSGMSIASTPVAGTMDPGSIFAPFERYYDRKLRALGWVVANDLAAGGHVGGQTGYRKAGATILTRFSILYHTVSPTSPSECPCDVTLSLFSAR